MLAQRAAVAITGKLGSALDQRVASAMGAIGARA